MVTIEEVVRLARLRILNPIFEKALTTNGVNNPVAEAIAYQTARESRRRKILIWIPALFVGVALLYITGLLSDSITVHFSDSHQKTVTVLAIGLGMCIIIASILFLLSVLQSVLPRKKFAEELCVLLSKLERFTDSRLRVLCCASNEELILFVTRLLIGSALVIIRLQDGRQEILVSAEAKSSLELRRDFGEKFDVFKALGLVKADSYAPFFEAAEKVYQEEEKTKAKTA